MHRLLPTVLLMLAFAPAATATTNPRVCGKTSWKGKTYVIKTHQLTCSKGKPYAIDYLRHRRKPAGWRCERFDPRETKIRFICRKSGRDFLAIRQ